MEVLTLARQVRLDYLDEGVTRCIVREAREYALKAISVACEEVPELVNLKKMGAGEIHFAYAIRSDLLDEIAIDLFEVYRRGNDEGRFGETVERVRQAEDIVTARVGRSMLFGIGVTDADDVEAIALKSAYDLGQGEPGAIEKDRPATVGGQEKAIDLAFQAAQR